jgi:uncharacterized protein YdaU (DUF1376 family)
VAEKKPKAMMFYPEVWLASPDVLVMSPATRSGYHDILCFMWLHGGSLPDDEEALRKFSRLSAREWKEGRAEILARLRRTDDGRYTHGRLAEEYERAVAGLERKSERGKVAANARWKQSASNATSMPQAMQQASRKHRRSNASAMPTETETETDVALTLSGESNKARGARALDPSLPPARMVSVGEFGYARLSPDEIVRLNEAIGADEASRLLVAFDRWVAEDPTGRVAGGKRRRDRNPYRTVLAWHSRRTEEKLAKAVNGKFDGIREFLASEAAR